MSERRFEGIWIPASIWLMKGLSATDKCLLVEIHSLDSTDRHCFASNAHLAEFLGCSEDTVTRGIKKLCSMKLIETGARKTPIGSERVLVSKMGKDTPPPQNAETPSSDSAYIPPPQNAEHSSSLVLRDLNSTEEPPKSPKGESRTADAHQVLDYLNDKATKHFKPTQAHLRMILSRFRDGFTVDDCKRVIDSRVAKWGKDDKMREYLRPSTLFRPSNFDGYLNDDSSVPMSDSDRSAWLVEESRRLQEESLRNGTYA